MTEETKKDEVTLELDEAEKDRDEFEAAFEEAVEDKPQTEVDPEPDKSGTEETKVIETDETGDDPLSKVPDTPVVDDVAKTREQELEEELAAANHKMATWDGRISAANERARIAEEKNEEALRAKDLEKEDEEKEVLPDSKDEEAIKEFMDEFPDLHKPILALVKRDLLPVIGQMIDDRLGKLEAVLPEVQSIKSKMDEDTTAVHFKEIDAVHKDWRQINGSGALDKWIETQPSYIRDALKKVKAEGSSDEVIDMFDQYKKAVGIKPTKTDPPDTASSKAEDLLAVPSSAQKIVTEKAEKDKDDFDSAWNEATKDGFK